MGGILTLPKAMADDSSVTTATITVPIACSMSSTTDTAHTAEVPNGIDSRGQDYYPDGIGQTTLKVYCNDNEGFSVYAVGYSDDTLGNTYLRDSTLGQTSDILTSTTFTGNTSAWAMKIGVTSGTYTPIIAGSTGDSEKQSGDTDYSGWAAVPSTYTRVAYRNSGTDVDNKSIYTEGSSLTTTYAVYVSPTQIAGTYIGQVKYTLVHPASEVPLQPQPTTAGQICYYPNGSRVEGTMGCQSVSSLVTLLASNFSREGYGFAGWSDRYDYSTGAHFYGPQETITLNTADYSGSNPGLSLYAVWVKSAGNLQDSSKVATVCNGLTQAPTDGTANLSSVSALTDQRDNETYAIAKLADGNCWMIENLRLESTNSDNSTGALAQGYGTSVTYGNFSGLADAESTGFSNTYSPNSLYSNDGSNDTINIGTSNYPAYRMPRYNNLNTPESASNRPQNPTSNSFTSNNTTVGMYSYGNYYTWHAAIADLTYKGTNNQSVTNTSLCPSGWRLPKGGQTTVNTTAEFYVLGKSLMKDSGGNSIEPNQNASNGYGYYDNTPINADGYTATKAFRKYPNNFLYSGNFYSSAINRGSFGGYWSSTAYGYNYSYSLNLYSTSVYPGTYNSYKSYGYSVRCIVSPST